MNGSTYPTRQKLFLLHYLRALKSHDAAHSIGADACWLVTIVAQQEDETRYRGAVSFWSGQLMQLAGISSESQLTRVRRRAVSAGWLVYIPGGTRRPGTYWVTIPDEPATPDPLPGRVAPVDSDSLHAGGNPEPDCFHGGGNPASITSRLPPPLPPPWRPSYPNPFPKNNSPPPPPPPFGSDSEEVGGAEEGDRDGDESIEAAKQAVASCGVNQADPAVDLAIANGLTAATVLEIVDVYRRSQVRRTPGELYNRLTAPGMHRFAVGDGWITPEPRRRKTTSEDRTALDGSQTELEAMHGAVLDALSADELKQLTAAFSERDRRDLATLGRQHREFRPRLLRLIAARDGTRTATESTAVEHAHTAPAGAVAMLPGTAHA